VALAPPVLEHAGTAPLVHLAGKGRDAHQIEDALHRCSAAGVGSVLLTGGDGVSSLDARELIRLASTSTPAVTRLGVLMLPSAVRGAVSWERAVAKREAGADAFIAQVSWDLAERSIVAEWQARLGAPIIGAVLPLTQGRLRFLAEHRIGGIVVPPALRARVATDGPEIARRRLALDLVLLRRLGYAGAHISGILTPALLASVLDEADHLQATLGDDWRDAWRTAVGIT
jgi:methylenetetrahydrofolate reductase (NADPH)